MNKFAFCLIGLPLGLLAGSYVGSWASYAAFGTGNHMDASGIFGLLIGAPIGTVAGGVLGLRLGSILDRKTGSRLTRARVFLICIATAIGAATGLPMYWRWHSNMIMVVGAWVGALCGCLLCAIAKRNAEGVQ